MRPQPGEIAGADNEEPGQQQQRQRQDSQKDGRSRRRFSLLLPPGRISIFHLHHKTRNLPRAQLRIIEKSVFLRESEITERTVHIFIQDGLGHHRQGCIIFDRVDDIAFGRAHQPLHTLQWLALAFSDFRKIECIYGISVPVRLRTGKQQPRHTVGRLEAFLPHQFVAKQTAPGLRVAGNPLQQLGTVGSGIRNRQPLHHPGIAGHIHAEIIQRQQIVCLAFFGERKRINLLIEKGIRFHITTCLGIEMPQLDRSTIVPLFIAHPPGKRLALLEASLCGVEVERKEFIGDAHLRLEAKLLIVRRRRNPPQGFNLVQLARHINPARSDIPVQLIEQRAHGPRLRTPGRTAARRHNRDSHQHQHPQRPSAGIHAIKVSNISGNKNFSPFQSSEGNVHHWEHATLTCLPLIQEFRPSHPRGNRNLEAQTARSRERQQDFSPAAFRKRQIR